MTRTEALCKAFGWQGGTIHQVASETGCDSSALLYGKPTSEMLNSDFSHGWFAARTCSLRHNLTVVFPKYKGKVDFWLGVAKGLQLNQTTPHILTKEDIDRIGEEAMHNGSAINRNPKRFD